MRRIKQFLITGVALAIMLAAAWVFLPNDNPPPPPDRGLQRPATKPAEKRIALVIGNADYQYVAHLNNPEQDAKLLAGRLQSLGFELVDGKIWLDLDKPKMDEAVEHFGRQLAQNPGAIGLFYYAGHAMQVDGENYLIPVSANPNKPSDLPRQTLTAAGVLQEMRDAGVALNLLILDACRNNPFAGRGLREVGGGLAEIKKVPKGTLIVYATQPGNVAQDGPPGGNSPFAQALAAAIAQPGLEVRRSLDQTGLAVMQATGDSQQPWVSTSPLEGEFCFAGCATKTAAADSCQGEQAFWDDVNKQNPAELQAYLEQFPGCTHAKLAQTRIAALQNPPAPPVQAAKPIAPAPAPKADCPECPDMVWVEGGTFMMGSDTGDKDEEPRHAVTVSGFYLGKYEVTQQQWQAVMGNNPSHFTQCGGQCPVENVSYKDVQEYIRRLNAKTGQHYRLPTEAESEYACRSGGKEQTYCGGEDVDRLGWYWENAGKTTHPVGSKAANGLGLYDMSGNVREWTCSEYTEQGYGSGSESSCNNGTKGHRAVRGGSWDYHPQILRSSNRDWSTSDGADYLLGFRLARAF